MYLTVRMKDGRGLVICDHRGHCYLGLTKDAGKGLLTRYQIQDSWDAALEKARNLCRAWRSRGGQLKTQTVLK